MQNSLTVEEFAATADGSFAVDIARGVPMERDQYTHSVYNIGFAAGATWALAQLKEAK